MADSLEQIETIIYPEPISAIGMMTDGLIRLALDLAENEPYAPFFDPLLQFAAQVEDVELAADDLSNFLASERVCERTDDDKTLVLVVRNEIEI
jgi:hypothetical protein